MADIMSMPKLGFDMAEGTLVNWVKKEGDEIKKGELLAEIETDKATVEVDSLYDGIVGQLLVEAGSIVPVNQPIAIITAPDEEFDIQALLGKTDEDSATSTVETGFPELKNHKTDLTSEIETMAKDSSAAQLPLGLRVSPLARKMAKEHDLDLRLILGTGPMGRIVKADIETHLSSAGSKPNSVETAFPSTSLGKVGQASIPADQHIPLTRLRQAISRRMRAAKQEAPHFYVTREFDMAPLMAIRKQYNQLLADSGEKLSVNDFIIKAVALSLRHFPNLNASIAENEIIQHGHIHIGVAVSLENGLLTVVTQDADQKDIRSISAEVKSKALRARAGKVQPGDVEGSTFSISNLGMYEVDNFIAIINPPEAAILAVGAAREVPVVEQSALGVGWRMKASISVDHRISDGAEAARFMQLLANHIEQPLSLIV